jgi:hypothetical protein
MPRSQATFKGDRIGAAGGSAGHCSEHSSPSVRASASVIARLILARSVRAVVVLPNDRV